jgi:SAM-dependent methyltransferase
MSPMCESYLPEDKLDTMEPFYPLNVWVCHECFLVQINDYVTADEIFVEYAYYSSFSSSWLKHAEDYVAMITDRLGLGDDSFVVELASNDGYLLQYFVERGIPCLGVEPSKNVSEAAAERGVPTDVSFFGEAKAIEMAAAGKIADLVLGNNVLAQVPDLNDFVAGLAHVLAPRGVLTLEFPHLLCLLEETQFDTIYHEHFSYFSLTTIALMTAAHGLVVVDVEELSTHGGSLRVYLGRADGMLDVAPAVGELLERERVGGYATVEGYAGFEERVREAKRALLTFLINARRTGLSVAGYGAPGKGNTLLNYCGIRTDLLDYTLVPFPDRYGTGNDSVTAGTLNNAQVRSEHIQLDSVAKFAQLTLNFEHRFSHEFHLDAFAGISRSDSGVPHDTTINYDNRAYDNYRFDFTNDETPLLAFNGHHLDGAREEPVLRLRA